MQNAVALGTFDGLHKGHLSVLDIPDGYNKIALIFNIPPKCIKKGSVELLLTPEKKIKMLEKLSCDVKTLDFSEVEHLTPAEFLEYIKKEFNPAIISCGFNYHFGFEGKGDAELLAEFCGENNIALKIANPVTEDGEIVSSSVIRKALREGEIKKVNRLLGYDFSFTSPIIKGDGRGKTLGFPTINQAYPEVLCKPKFGVYKTEVLIESKVYKGVTDIGNRPTYPIDFLIAETFIIGFNGDLYGKELKVTLKEFIRSEKKFSSKEELMIQIKKDIGE
ncbi:MAG: riboflavin biosynthesis protein RibF [Clostridia bacterium]|nr:riboflavin biosynthesis protein RibF [Clostridia bacterium]